FVMDLATKETKQLTHVTDFDIKFPSMGKQSIVFEQAGHIWRYDLATGQATPVPIDIKEDFDSGRGGLVDAAKHIESVNLAPDGKKLLWSERSQRLRYVDVASNAVTLVDQDKFGEIQGYNWSPDSQWITWARPEENDMPRVYLYSLANKQQTAVTDSWYGSGEPVFSDDGKYLLLASARDFKPTFGDQEFANVYRDMQRVYLVTL